jgi:hypothetical protein
MQLQSYSKERYSAALRVFVLINQNARVFRFEKHKIKIAWCVGESHSFILEEHVQATDKSAR